MTRANVLELAFIGGLAAIVRGVHLIYEPAAWIIGGLALSGCAYAIARFESAKEAK